VKIKGRGAQWQAELTEAGLYFVAYGEYPPGHFWPEPDKGLFAFQRGDLLSQG
jgi:hypothetical protein